MKLQLCILASIANVDAVRIAAKTLPIFANSSTLLPISLSPTGEVPPTHYFCAMNVPPDPLLQSIMDLQNLSTIQIIDSQTFLQQQGLKIIKTNVFPRS